jgi:SH3-like domain-containing protein
MRPARLLALALVLLPCAPLSAADEAAKPPYWGSIAAGRARMRTGPARSYPASWLYQRSDLPVRVLASYKEWRRVRDPDGTEGWILGTLISRTRTALIRGPEPVPMRERPIAAGRLLYRAAPGVVGRVSQCANGWCRFDVKGQVGFVETGDRLWGVEPGEVLP